MVVYNKMFAENLLYILLEALSFGQYSTNTINEAKLAFVLFNTPVI